MDSATAAWEPHGNYALIKLAIKAHAYTDSILPDATFDVHQDITIRFDPGSESLTLTPGPVSVSADVGGPFGGLAEGQAENALGPIIEQEVSKACASAAPQLSGLSGRKHALVDQLRKLDPHASARFVEGVFQQDDVILRGRIGVTARSGPVVEFVAVAGADEFDALSSWIPGGRVDEINWSWRFYDYLSIAAAAGDRSFKDRFVLRRPRFGFSRFGRPIYGESELRLPGLDGDGKVCLEIKGVRTDPVTGALVPVTSSVVCHTWGFDFRTAQAAAHEALIKKLKWKVRDPRRLPGPLHELGIRTIGNGDPGPNVLLVHVGKAWSDEIANSIREGLESCARQDAGLLVVALFQEGFLDEGGKDLAYELAALADSMPASLMVNDDLGGEWAAAFGLEKEGGGPAWRLLNPGGGIVWARDGHVYGEELATDSGSRLVPVVATRVDPAESGSADCDRLPQDDPPVGAWPLPAGSVLGTRRGHGRGVRPAGRCRLARGAQPAGRGVLQERRGAPAARGRRRGDPRGRGSVAGRAGPADRRGRGPGRPPFGRSGGGLLAHHAGGQRGRHGHRVEARGVGARR